MIASPTAETQEAHIIPPIFRVTLSFTTPYPASSTALSRSASFAFEESYSTEAVSVPRFTLAPATPSTSFKASSTVDEQDAHIIPDILSSAFF